MGHFQFPEAYDNMALAYHYASYIPEIPSCPSSCKVLYVLSKSDLKKGLIPIPEGLACVLKILSCPAVFRQGLSYSGVRMLHEQRHP